MDALALMDPAIIAFTALGLCIVALILLVVITLRQSRLLQRYRLLLNGQTGKDLETILLGQAKELEDAKQALAGLQSKADRLEADAQRHIQRTGMVRFNAFPDTGSDLSFAVAILDAHDNGFVLSSLYGRHENRIYAKPIRNGASTYLLTDEERQALDLARTQGT